MVYYQKSFNDAVAKTEQYASSSLVAWIKYATYCISLAKASKMYWVPVLRVLTIAKRNLSRTANTQAVTRIDSLLTCVNMLY